MTRFTHHLYVACPWCDKGENRVDHLEAGCTTIWYCDDCGRPFEVKVDEGMKVAATCLPDHPVTFKRNVYSLLKFDGAQGPTFFVLKSALSENTRDPQTPQEQQEHQRYFYEEHSCPTNWLGDCVMVAQNADTDPHGFLDFVRFEVADEPIDEDEDATIARMFPEVLVPWSDTAGVSVPQGEFVGLRERSETYITSNATTTAHSGETRTCLQLALYLFDELVTDESDDSLDSEGDPGPATEALDQLVDKVRRIDLDRLLQIKSEFDAVAYIGEINAAVHEEKTRLNNPTGTPDDSAK